MTTKKKKVTYFFRMVNQFFKKLIFEMHRRSVTLETDIHTFGRLTIGLCHINTGILTNSVS